MVQKPLDESEFRSLQTSMSQEMNRGLKFNFYIWSETYRSNEFTQSFQVGVVRHDWDCSKLDQIVSQLHLKNELRYKIFFFYLW